MTFFPLMQLQRNFMRDILLLGCGKPFSNIMLKVVTIKHPHQAPHTPSTPHPLELEFVPRLQNTERTLETCSLSPVHHAVIPFLIGK